VEKNGKYGKFFFENFKVKRTLEDPDVNWRMILKWICGN
jgi:hypothetical protein